MVPAQLEVARIAVVFGLVDIFLGLGRDIPDPCFDIACRVGAACCLQSDAIVWATGGGTVVDEEIAGWLEGYSEDKPGVKIDEVVMVATFEFARDTRTVLPGPCLWMPKIDLEIFRAFGRTAWRPVVRLSSESVQEG